MGVRRRHLLILMMLIGLTGALGAAGCDRGADDGARRGAATSSSSSVEGANGAQPARQPTGERVTVFATVYPLADVTRQVGGRWVSVEWAVEHGQTLADFTPPDDMRLRLNLAQLLVTGGAATEAWAVDNDAGAALVKSRRVLRMPAPQRTAQSAQSATQENGTGDIEEEPAGQQFDAIGQPWLDPIAVRGFADTIAWRLAALRPAGEAEFHSNAAALQRDINTIVVESRPRLGDLSYRPVLVLSGDFNALLSRFNVEPVQAVNQPSALRLTPEQIGALRDAAQTRHIHTLLLEAGTPRAVADDVASRVGVDVIFIDSYGSSASTGGASSYQDLLRFNLQQLAKIR